MPLTPDHLPALRTAARAICDWAQVPPQAEAIRADCESLLARHWPAPATPAPLPAGYLSFLLCFHHGGSVVHAYVNGQPIGVTTAAGFTPHQLGQPGAKRALTFREVADPCPYATLADLKRALHEAVESITLEEPARDGA